MRFLYYEEVHFDSEQIALKLLIFTDKYLQNDLNEKCMDFLISNLNSNNIYIILDFARQENLSHLKNWCMRFLKNNLTTQNISGLVQYLYQQSYPGFTKDNSELKFSAISFITAYYTKICQENLINAKFYEDFLIQNISAETIVLFVNFIYGKSYETAVSLPSKEYLTVETFASYAVGYEKAMDQAKHAFEYDIINIRNSSFAFAAKNFKQLVEKGINKDLSHQFLSDLILYLVKNEPI